MCRTKFLSFGGSLVYNGTIQSTQNGNTGLKQDSEQFCTVTDSETATGLSSEGSRILMRQPFQPPRQLVVASLTVIAVSVFVTGIPAQAQPIFTEIGAAGLAGAVDSNGSSVVDIDGDDLEDLLVIGGAPLRELLVYQSDGHGHFTDVTASWPGLRPTGPDTPSFTSWADFDNDGDADTVLFLPTSVSKELRFLQNNIGAGQQSFTEIQTIVSPSISQDFSLAAWADFDNDGDLDVFVGGQHAPSMLLKNNLKESGIVSFTDDSSRARLVPQNAQASSAHWADADDDGDLDLLTVNDFRGAIPRDLFYRNLLVETGDAVFEEVTGLLGFHVSSLPSFTAVFGDYDNDADQDVYFGLGHFTPNLLYTNNVVETGILSFTEEGGALGVQEPIDGGISLWGDLDNDGDLDLLAGDPSAQPRGPLPEPAH